MICPICKTPWLVIGNLLAGVFQEYEQQCDCETQPVNQEEIIGKPPKTQPYLYNESGIPKVTKGGA